MTDTWQDVIKRATEGNLAPERRVEKTPEQWRAELDADSYQVTRQHGTEAPFSSEMCGLLEPGLYACICCATPLFDSTNKFDSRTGWPSFSQALGPNVINYIMDNSHGMQRVETTCSTCDAHLGHVFPDGPPPSGLRYCMNAVALKKITQDADQSAG